VELFEQIRRESEARDSPAHGALPARSRPRPPNPFVSASHSRFCLDCARKSRIEPLCTITKERKLLKLKNELGQLETEEGDDPAEKAGAVYQEFQEFRLPG
jgi:hypothetical protein